MKTSLKKRLGTVTLVLVMLLGFIPIAPKASASCEYTLHTPDLTTLYPADWNAQTGGYGYDYYKCKLCGWGCDENGRSHVFVDASNGCSGGYKCHVPGNPYTTACSGTFKDTLYYCSGCNEVIDSDGTLADMTVLDGHTPDTTTSFPADYTQCNGGYKTAYYTCTVCNEPTDANGNGVVWSAPTGHDPDLTTLYPADWNAQTGGYGYDYYKCKLCGWGCDENGRSHVFVDASNGCSGGYKCHLPGSEEQPADYTPCFGGFKTPYYLCTNCNTPVDANGTVVLRDAGGQHTPGSELQPANYTPCNGGFTSDFYFCTECGNPVNADGSDAQYTDGTGVHTPGSELQPANYTPCYGGFKNDFYICTDCDCPVNADGSDAEFTDGTGVHTPGSELQPANYAPCSGGFKNDFYICTDCDCPVNADGSDAEFTEGTGKHTPGDEKQPANYAPCSGGFKNDFYICTDCDCPVNADGSDAEFTEGTGVHTPGSELQPANYSPCNGGFKTDFYICIFCECPLDENGEEPVWYDGNGEHTLVQVPEKAPTYEEYGYVSFWQCKYCGTAYKDAEGTAEIVDVEEILLPKLEKPADENQRVNVTTGIEEVPQSIADKYTSVDDVQKELVKAAVTAESKLDGDNTKSVLLDVELQIQNSDGTWEAVTPENFPEEGVEVLLPYPEGTNKDDYTFVVTHMITSGSRAGEVEVLNGTLEDDGIRVKFTSMSPVVIAYQEITAEEPAEDKPTEDKPTEDKPTEDKPTEDEPTEDKPTEDEPTDKNSPQTGDSSYLVLWTVMLLSSGLCLVCLTRKKKAK